MTPVGHRHPLLAASGTDAEPTMTEPACDRRVLIVEDDRDVRDSLLEVLEDNEYRPVAAANGQEALEQLRQMSCPPCLILLDVMMPVMDGWQFRAEQRDDPSLSAIPVVVISAHASAAEAAQKMSAAGFLKKPVRLESLLQTVERYCHGDDA
jgi:CheY-like chemotaxis protein